MDRYLNLKRLAIPVIFVGLTMLFSGCSKETLKSTPPKMVLQPASMVRAVPNQVNPQPQWVVVSNAGDGKITYEAIEDISWMTLFGNTSGQATDSFGVNISVGLLDEGAYVETVWVSSSEASNSPLPFEINLFIEHVINVVPNAINFLSATGVGNPPGQTLALSSGSAASFEYTVTWTNSWLNVTPVAGQGPETLSVSVDVSALTTGVFVDTIRIDVPTGANTPILVPCSLTVVSWLRQENPETKGLRGVYFRDANNGWAVGIVSGAFEQTGYVISSSNGGELWNAQTLGISQALGDVQFTSSQIGWAAGVAGLVIKTTNGGLDWVRKVTGDTSQYEGLFFLNDTLGWVVGSNDAVLYTVDGGSTWEQRPTGFGNDLTEVEFVSQDSGWVVGFGGSIFFTSNGGLNWTQQRSVPGFELRDIDMVDNMHGWAVGQSGAILSTSNAGTDWTPALPVPDTVQFWGVAFSSINNGWVCGDNGKIYHTTDGINWVLQPSGTNEILHDLFFLDDNSGWAVGGAGVVLHTETGGL